MLEQPFMLRACAAAMLVGVACALIGSHLVLRRMSFMSDALPHAILPGAVLASLFGVSLLAGTIGTALLAAVLIATFSRRRRLHEDSAIGVAYTSLFALGVLLMSISGRFTDFHSLLFGNLLAVSNGDIIAAAAILGTVFVGLGLLHRDLELSALDEEFSTQAGRNPERVRLLLLVLTALTVAIAVQMVGVLLVAAFLITPATAASLVGRSVAGMMVAAALLAVCAGVAGISAAYWLNVSTSASIVLANSIAFGTVWLLKLRS